jgi:hypothetical protein
MDQEGLVCLYRVEREVVLWNCFHRLVVMDGAGPELGGFITRVWDLGYLDLLIFLGRYNLA